MQVMPAESRRLHCGQSSGSGSNLTWIPAFAGMSGVIQTNLNTL